MVDNNIHSQIYKPGPSKFLCNERTARREQINIVAMHANKKSIVSATRNQKRPPQYSPANARQPEQKSTAILYDALLCKIKETFKGGLKNATRQGVGLERVIF